ncbi:nodal modulator 1-like [Sesbania bispinosa]|nr:nodal modulator 1-like [Sesbania bispinosa]
MTMQRNNRFERQYVGERVQMRSKKTEKECRCNVGDGDRHDWGQWREGKRRRRTWVK